MTYQILNRTAFIRICHTPNGAMWMVTTKWGRGDGTLLTAPLDTDPEWAVAMFIAKSMLGR